MATGGGLALPEHLQDEDACSWFKQFEVCAAANGWDNAKKLLRLPTLLSGRAWAIYDSLDEESTDTYSHLKSALLQRLCPDTEEDHLAAQEQLSTRKLQEGRDSIMKWPVTWRSCWTRPEIRDTTALSPNKLLARANCTPTKTATKG